MAIAIGPQPGPQTTFLSTLADVAIYGGGAGSGKSYALLLEPLRHHNNSRFGGVIFRRSSVQVRNQGGLWHESLGLYTQFAAHPRESFLEWRFPSGMKIKFAHLEHDKTVYDWQGSQIAFLAFDELTHFSSHQFFYMLSRNRSASGVAGYVRATTNPDCDSWVRDFVDWWIDKETGYPIKERSGVVRWFIRRDDLLIWADSRQELIDTHGADELPKSVTFISALITDNPIMMAKDPSYMANLKALSRVERLRLLGGNWNVRECAGLIFQREWFEIIDVIPGGWTSAVRFWDRAATKPNEVNKDPDWTRGLLLYRYPNNLFVIADLRSMRDTPGQVETLIKNVASHDSTSVRVMSQQDPGSAGVAEAINFKRMLAGFDVRTMLTSKDKITRAKPVSAQAEAGNIKVLRAIWNEELFNELENFPDGKHDDICLKAGTKIATPFGDKNIEDIRRGDRVITPLGIKKVLASSCTGEAPVISAHGLIGTPTHPVFQEQRGFIPLDCVSGSLINLLSWKCLIRWNAQKLLFLTESPTKGWAGKSDIIYLNRLPIREGKILRDCILQFTNFIRKLQFLKAFTFITKIAIHSIIISIIWNVYRPKSIVGFLKLSVKKIKNIWQKLDHWHRRGIDPKQAGPGIPKTPLAVDLEIRIASAFCAVMDSKQNLATPSFVPSFVPVDPEIIQAKNGRSQRFASIAEKTLLRNPPDMPQKQKPAPDSVPNDLAWEKVYNLTIDDAHCYFANGILTGNCDTLSGAFNEMCQGNSIMDVFHHMK